MNVVRGCLYLAGFCLVVFHLPTSQALQCYQCERDSCPVPSDCPGGLALDPCDCCPVCARVVNESCGGKFGLLGRCDTGLVCSISPEQGSSLSEQQAGICKAASQEEENCDKANCNVVFAPECPADSLLVGGTPPPGECCPDEPSCQCLLCVPHDLECPTGSLKVKVTEGTGKPGVCCDIYECKDQVEVCADVECEDDPLLYLECPSDSMKMLPIITQGGCCVKHQGCTCKPKEDCPVVACGEGLHAVTLDSATGYPGHCCHNMTCVNKSSTTCRHDGQERMDGETWKMDKCTTCTCNNMLTSCSHVDCQLPEDCGWAGVPEGECCHVCYGCFDNGQLYDNGAEWMREPCVTCQCEEGRVYCQATSCAVHCTNPRVVPGECCPVCDQEEEVLVLTTMESPSNAVCPSLEQCVLSCPHGHVLDMETGCALCQCLPPETETICLMSCPEGFKQDDLGNDLCECREDPAEQCRPLGNCDKECLYGYRVNKEGCIRCKCNRCPEFVCDKRCADGYVHNTHGCQICKCLDPSVPPIEGLVIPPTRPPPGRCMSVDGRMMEEGQSWHDGCRQCFCYKGGEMCALISCPVPLCHNPIIRIGDCCPSCEEEVTNGFPGKTTRCQAKDGRHFAEGETWALDQCTQCICHEGGMLCQLESCPPVLCHHPVKRPDRCCPVCPEGDSLFPPMIGHPHQRHCMSKSGNIFSAGDTWRVSSCQSCACMDGQIHCFSQTCPLLNCNRTILKKGQCCPYCLDEEVTEMQTCQYNGIQYDSGESWVVDDCTKCICHEGQPMCTGLTCQDPPNCSNAIRVQGLCCPVCRNNTVVPTVIEVKTERGRGENNQNKSDEESPPKAPPEGHQATVTVLVTLVVLLLLIIFVLLFFLLRRRRRTAQHDNKHTNATQTCLYSEVKKRPKSTNLDLQGVNPLLQHSSNDTDCQKVAAAADDKYWRYSAGDEKLLFGCQNKIPEEKLPVMRYSLADEKTMKLLDLPHCDNINNYRKSL